MEGKTTKNIKVPSEGVVKKKSLKLVIGSVILIGLFVVGFVLYTLWGDNKVHNTKKEDKTLVSELLMISKDDNYSYINIDENKIFSLTENLKDYDSEEIVEESLPVISMDGAKIFYLDDGFSNLYCKNLKEDDEEKAVTKIDTNVEKFLIDELGKWVVYIKKDGNALYVNNLEEKNKISNDVNGFYINNDASKILYVKKDGEIHLFSDKSNDKVLDRNSDIKYVSEDFSFLIYLKEKSLYKYYIDGNKEKIAQDVAYVEKVFEDGNCFFVCNEIKNMTCGDYVSIDILDDEQEILDLLEKLEINNFEHYLKESGEDYDEAAERYSSIAYEEILSRLYDYDNDYEMYKKFIDSYDFEKKLYEVISKIALDKRLNNKTFEYINANLYFYDGESSNKITEDYDAGLYANKNVYSYSTYDMENIEASHVSSLQDLGIELMYNLVIEDVVQEIADELEYKIFEKVNTYICVGESKINTDGSIHDLKLSDNGNECYYLMSDGGNDFNYELYKIQLNEAKENKKPIKVYDDVSAFGFYGESGKLYTLRNEPEGCSTADLYCEDKSVCYAVDIYSFGEKCFIPGTDECYVLADCDEDGYIGTLYKWNGEKTIKIYDDVNDNICVYEDVAFFIGDYSSESSFGSVYKTEGEKAEIVDQDNVEQIFMGVSSVECNLNAMNDLYYMNVEDMY